ncbi:MULTISPECIES: response regulator [Roseivirga]|jgi:signal transduction histidine kinase|uniref:histidine kinase n=1 Tax=Roseivirga thermotolerans TaxID=1758176 RepID=A0ABQ3I2X3_9BACT|nr:MULTISPECIES: response regulator [Roseivirga]MEC7754858.1 response regulator [Bacteroidota bacterium]GHE59594.1 hypothetical protein GCM10011340_12880 [Roseivirga thermotolerans]|tara:strand:+ start:1768 stop:2823 length:1056 start_codon:yes stop_codon:yes gene_type:complete
MNQRKVLLIEDNLDDRFLIKEFLSFSTTNYWKVEEAARISTALEKLDNAKPDVILLDLSLPDSQGVDSFQLIKRNVSSTPIIILTGFSDVSLAKQLIKQGAQDYLVKGEYDPRLLEKSIEYGIERHRLKLENERAKERLLDSVLEAQDKERSRIAKELHDGVVQSLTAVSLNLGVLRQWLKKTDEDTLKHYEKCTTNLASTIDEIRNISHSLMPRSIADMPLTDALEGLIEDIEKACDIKFEFVASLEKEPEEKLKLTLYRIVQELVNNALKHSEANTLFVQLIEYPEYLLLMVEDDGVGFDKTNTLESKNCFGLYSIESRVNSLGGTIELDTKPGQGTNVFVSFPKNLEN